MSFKSGKRMKIAHKKKTSKLDVFFCVSSQGLEPWTH